MRCEADQPVAALPWESVPPDVGGSAKCAERGVLLTPEPGVPSLAGCFSDEAGERDTSPSDGDGMPRPDFGVD